VRALFAENKVRFARAEELCLLADDLHTHYALLKAYLLDWDFGSYSD